MDWLRIGKVAVEAIAFAVDDLKVLIEKSIAVWFILWFIITIASCVFSLFEVIAYLDQSKRLPPWMILGPWWLFGNGCCYILWWFYYCVERAKKRLQ